MKKYFDNFIAYFWIGLVGLFIYMWTSDLEFADKTIYGIALFVLSAIPIYYAFFQRKNKNDAEKVFSVVFSFALIVLFLFSNITSWGGAYKTQFITHRSKSNPNYRIEFQMMDVGALGYRKRTVEVKDLTFLFKWVTRVDEEMIDLNKWAEVDEYVNELNLKGG
nr:hypothetical protein [Allomuricauda sp.]